ncbi:hypothetical protein ACFWHG_34615 [Streptomyces microflavus]|uniref:hypothetical protein n=1 Tax=Streptomyces microflavus TaxID=1919 RepID=UPI00364CD9BB
MAHPIPPAETVRQAAATLAALADAAAEDAGQPTARWSVRYQPGVLPGAPPQRDRPCYLVATDRNPGPAAPHLIRSGSRGGPNSRATRPTLAPQHAQYIAAMDPTTGLALARLLATLSATDPTSPAMTDALALAHQILNA